MNYSILMNVVSGARGIHTWFVRLRTKVVHPRDSPFIIRTDISEGIFVGFHVGHWKSYNHISSKAPDIACREGFQEKVAYRLSCFYTYTIR